MAEVESVTGVTSVPPNSVPAGTAPGGALGKDEFLQLLMEQMKNQDPLDPMKSTDMIAQLAQFSSLEQIKNLNSTFEAFSRQDGLIQSMLLKGQTVQATLAGGETVEGTIESVVYGSDGMTLTINNTAYPMSGITSLSLVEAAGEATAIPAG